MLSGTSHLERHNKVAGIEYRNICAEYELEAPGTQWTTSPKVFENDRTKILWNFHLQTERKMLVVNQPEIMVVNKQVKTASVADVTNPSDSNMRQKEQKKLKKYQGLREEP